jgi:positive regulator of sigma E activity
VQEVRKIMTLIGVILIGALLAVYLFFSDLVQAYLIITLTFIMACIMIAPLFAKKSKKNANRVR